jgi:hypothetical protein
VALIVVRSPERDSQSGSIGAALAGARAGDIVLVEAGHYSPSRSGEALPLRVPPGVTLVGAGRERCIVDGEGQFQPSHSPIRPETSVLLLADGASVSGLTITNGGGFGIGLPLGAATSVRDCAITRHGGHGIYVQGPEQAIISGCQFEDNGLARFSPAGLQRSTTVPRQGHHIFAQARPGVRNWLAVTDNQMRRCYADAVAMGYSYDLPDAIAFRATVLRNTIAESERSAILFCCSFGPSDVRLQLEIAQNRLLDNQTQAIRLTAASPHSERLPRHGQLTALLSENEIQGGPVGIFAISGAGESHDNHCELILDRNRIADCSQAGVRLVAGLGLPGVATTGNSLSASLLHNTISGSAPSVLAQGADGPADSQPSDNRLALRLVDNSLSSSPQLVDGPLGNRAQLVEG